MRFGVIRAPMGRDTDPSKPDYKEVQAAVSKAVKVLIARGAEVIDPMAIPNIERIVASAGGGAGYESEAAIDAFLAQQPNAPVHSLRDIVASPVINAKRREELSRDLGRTTNDPGYSKEANLREELRLQILRVMAENKLDALIYATYDHAPTPVPVSTPGSNRFLAASLAFPALAVPAGFFADGLPIGIEFLGRPYTEGLLLKAAFDYEQVAKIRHPPATTPALAQEP
jgi:Asp-tRNA(Asn)/Glu-tRNA(Gln) amidotransferase A subunit family amidase